MKIGYKKPVVIAVCICCFGLGIIAGRNTTLPLANHRTPKAIANYEASDLVPFTEWNDISSHDTTNFKCSGGQLVTVDDVTTLEKQYEDSKLPAINMYQFLSVSQNGYVIAKNDVPDSRYLTDGWSEQLYTGDFMFRSSAGGAKSNGKTIIFTFFTITPKNENDGNKDKYYLLKEEGLSSSTFTCDKV